MFNCKNFKLQSFWNTMMYQVNQRTLLKSWYKIYAYPVLVKSVYLVINTVFNNTFKNFQPPFCNKMTDLDRLQIYRRTNILPDFWIFSVFVFFTTLILSIYVQGVSEFIRQTLKSNRADQKDSKLYQNPCPQTSS